jgi:hypothetical protein
MKTKTDFLKDVGKCIYCKKGPTKQDPMLMQVYAPGTYYQHWSWEGKGCKANIDNRNPLGEIVENQTI